MRVSVTSNQHPVCIVLEILSSFKHVCTLRAVGAVEAAVVYPLTSRVLPLFKRMPIDDPSEFSEITHLTFSNDSNNIPFVVGPEFNDTHFQPFVIVDVT